MMSYLLSLFKCRELIFGVFVVLAGCATRSVTTQSDGAQANPTDRLSGLILADLKSWCINGRSVARYNDSGWQASLRWCVDNDKLTLDISGPININRVFIRYLKGELWLQVSSSEVTISRSPQQLLQSKLGFSVPLTSIRYWLLGIAEPSQTAHVRVGKDGYNEQINQSGWSIDYSQYQAVNQFMLPRKIKINKDRIRLKIVVDEWEINR
ncbi:MAG: lipoprotein insertase outer membrane protein LolB [Gammaproteobacteria bacterium]|nr:lipoprotein insertase outer membrane protein LolB [Gammaproteobacteria bacterium]